MTRFLAAILVSLLPNLALAQVGPIPYSALGSSIGKVLGPLINYNGSGLPGYQVNLGLIIGRPTTASDNVSDFQVQRDANYTGGTFGFVNAAALFRNYARAGTASFENASVSILENYTTSADNSQNVAHISHTNARGTGPSWAGISELDDFGAADPTRARVTHEFDLFGNGTDANSQRIIVDAVVMKQVVGPVNQASWAYRIQNGNEGANGSWINVGFGAGTANQPMPINTVFDALYAVPTAGLAVPVNALRMAAGQRMQFDGTGTNYLSSNGTTTTFTKAIAAPDVVVNGTDSVAAAWTQITPVVTAVTGVITSTTGTLRTKKIGRTVFVNIDVTITNNGTGAGSVNVQVPCTAASNWQMVGRETANSGLMVVGSGPVGQTYVAITRYDNAYPGGLNNHLVLSGVCESAT